MLTNISVQYRTDTAFASTRKKKKAAHYLLLICCESVILSYLHLNFLSANMFISSGLYDGKLIYYYNKHDTIFILYIVYGRINNMTSWQAKACRRWSKVRPHIPRKSAVVCVCSNSTSVFVKCHFRTYFLFSALNKKLFLSQWYI